MIKMFINSGDLLYEGVEAFLVGSCPSPAGLSHDHPITIHVLPFVLFLP